MAVLDIAKLDTVVAEAMEDHEEQGDGSSKHHGHDHEAALVEHVEGHEEESRATHSGEDSQGDTQGVGNIRHEDYSCHFEGSRVRDSHAGENLHLGGTCALLEDRRHASSQDRADNSL